LVLLDKRALHLSTNEYELNIMLLNIIF